MQIDKYVCDGCGAIAEVEVREAHALPERPKGWAHIQAHTPLVQEEALPEFIQKQVDYAKKNLPPDMRSLVTSHAAYLKQQAQTPVSVSLDLCPACQDGPLFDFIRSKVPLPKLPKLPGLGKPKGPA